MAQSPTVLSFQGTQRITVFFTGSVGAAAFSSLSYYAVTNTDGKGASPINVLAVFAITGAPNALQVTVDSAFTIGANYQVAFTALPFTDSSTFTGSIAGTLPAQPNAPVINSESAQSDLSLQLYGRDLLFDDSNDFAEDATGDLATLSGRENWRRALNRRFLSLGLPWAPNYGPKSNDYVNAPDAYKLPLQSAILAQARADDRTKTASVDVISALGGVQGAYLFEIKATGKDKLDAVSVQVPVPV